MAGGEKIDHRFDRSRDNSISKLPDAALDMLAAMGRMTRKANALLQARVSRNVNEEIQIDRGNIVMRDGAVESDRPVIQHLTAKNEMKKPGAQP